MPWRYASLNNGASQKNNGVPDIGVIYRYVGNAVKAVGAGPLVGRLPFSCHSLSRAFRKFVLGRLLIHNMVKAPAPSPPSRSASVGESGEWSGSVKKSR